MWITTSIKLMWKAIKTTFNKLISECSEKWS
jgi:hypothetical protein